VEYHRYRPFTNPIDWETGVEDTLRAGIDTVAILLPPEQVRGQTLMRLRAHGVRRVLLPGERGWSASSPLWLALGRKLWSLVSPLVRFLGRTGPAPLSEQQCRDILDRVPPRSRHPRPLPDGPLRIAHLISSLNSGGAERQVCYAASQQQRQGHHVRVLTRLPLEGENAHYLRLLRPDAQGLPVRCLGGRWDARFPDVWRASGLHTDLLRGLPAELATPVVDLIAELLLDPVDVLHCYLDECNVFGGIAGWLTGTPGIILSFRNGNPSHFPEVIRPWMYPWYRALLDRPGISLSANASLGARDYEQWLGLPAGHIPVVRNAFVPPVLPGPEEVSRWREEHGIAPSAPLVAGVFRLHPEKRPLYFLECVARVRERVPALRVVLAGIGSLEPAVRRRIRELGLEQVVTLLGQRKDVPLILSASDVFLLVSDWEGTPNTVLEAQYCGCVPVATAGGGTGEAMVPGETGILVGLEELARTVQSVVELLGDPGRRRNMAAAGRAFVTRAYAPEALAEGNLRLYQETLRLPALSGAA
jgi:glycosyltransferase involved in cell wall biosynthesis